ncbi:MAG: hypothetical protein ACYS18_06915 [Planctomycetota bacterium]|jgi:hypothetical protein
MNRERRLARLRLFLAVLSAVCASIGFLIVYQSLGFGIIWAIAGFCFIWVFYGFFYGLIYWHDSRKRGKG